MAPQKPPQTFFFSSPLTLPLSGSPFNDCLSLSSSFAFIHLNSQNTAKITTVAAPVSIPHNFSVFCVCTSSKYGSANTACFFLSVLTVPPT